MIKFESINLSNVVTYKEQKFIFKDGVTVITGSNGSGKSLLFSSIGNSLYFSHPLSDKKDVKSLLNASLQENRDFEIEGEASNKKKGKIKKESSIELRIQNTTSEVNSTIIQKSTGENVSYIIKEGGDDLECRTIAISKEHIEKIFPLPEDIFYTCTYLSSYRNHPLLHGSSAQRYEFFERLFNFDLFDYLYEIFDKEYKVLEKEKVEVESLRQITLGETGENSPKVIAIQGVKKNISESEVSLNQAQDLVNNLTEIRFLVEKERSLEKDFAELVLKFSDQQKEQTKLFPLISFSSIDSTQYQKLKILYELKLEEDRKASFQESLQKSIKSSYESLSNFSNLPSSIEGIEGNLKGVREVIVKIKESLGNITEIKLWEAAFTKFRDSISVFCFEVGKPEEYISNLDLQDLKDKRTEVCNRIAKEEVLLEQQQDKLKNLLGLKEDQEREIVCHTCQSELSAEQIKNLKQEIEQQISSLRIKKDRQKKILALLDSYQESRKALRGFKSIDEILVQVESLSSKKQEEINLDTQIKKFHEALSIKDRITKLEKELQDSKEKSSGLVEGLESFQGFSSEEIFRLLDKIKEYKVLEKQLNTSKESLESFSKQLKEKVGSSGLKEIDKKNLKTIEDLLIESQRSVRELSSSIIENKTKLALLIKEIEQLNKYLEKIKEFDKKLELHKVYQNLSQTFHTKGYRLEKINLFIQIFEQTINKYAKYLFPNSIEFSIQLEKRDLSIIAKRNGYSSDVRFLSGSESRRFQLLALIAILYLLPLNKRADTCILDEMNAGMDNESTKMFYEQFIGELKKIVPKIVLITPLEAEGFYFTPDRSFRVEKNAEISQLVEE